MTHALPVQKALEIITDGVQRALGRPPRDFADYARDAAATGVWNLESL